MTPEAQAPVVRPRKFAPFSKSFFVVTLSIYETYRIDVHPIVPDSFQFDRSEINCGRGKLNLDARAGSIFRVWEQNEV